MGPTRRDDHGPTHVGAVVKKLNYERGATKREGVGYNKEGKVREGEDLLERSSVTVTALLLSTLEFFRTSSLSLKDSKVTRTGRQPCTWGPAGGIDRFHH